MQSAKPAAPAISESTNTAISRISSPGSAAAHCPGR